jgi:hypothetical protein
VDRIAGRGTHPDRYSYTRRDLAVRPHREWRQLPSAHADADRRAHRELVTAKPTGLTGGPSCHGVKANQLGTPSKQKGLFIKFNGYNISELLNSSCLLSCLSVSRREKKFLNNSVYRGFRAAPSAWRRCIVLRESVQHDGGHAPENTHEYTISSSHRIFDACMKY